MIAENKRPIDIYNQLANSETTLDEYEEIRILSLRENRNLVNALMEETDEI